VGGADLLLAAGTTLLVAIGGCWLLDKGRQQRSLVVRCLALAVIGGMGGYLLYALQVVQPERWGFLPDTAWVTKVAMAGLVGSGALLLLIVGARTAKGRK